MLATRNPLRSVGQALFDDKGELRKLGNEGEGSGKPEVVAVDLNGDGVDELLVIWRDRNERLWREELEVFGLSDTGIEPLGIVMFARQTEDGHCRGTHKLERDPAGGMRLVVTMTDSTNHDEGRRGCPSVGKHGYRVVDGKLDEVTSRGN